MENITQHSVEYQQELLVRMERNHRMVQRLSQKLNSYTCEPKCPKRFEKFYELNRSVEDFSKHHKNIMAKIRRLSFEIDDQDTLEIERHLKRFKKLESEYASYILDLKTPL
ncbi:hypothetical protein [Flagellimonas crocea]|uniref:hypothetical protein n=1 Tax=Flagellimonas crocea TaxID=3067311 RepID=UPI00296E8C56|nr:hypothetical protein [Muricauda sp. DH64]